MLGEDGAPFLDSSKDKAYIVSGKYWVNNHAHILIAKKHIAINKFVCYALNLIDYQPYVFGTTRLKLNQSSMKQIQIPLPPLESQEKIVSVIENIESKITNLDSTCKLLESQKTTILKSHLYADLD